VSSEASGLGGLCSVAAVIDYYSDVAYMIKFCVGLIECQLLTLVIERGIDKTVEGSSV
jgi:hypothetical protein